MLKACGDPPILQCVASTDVKVDTAFLADCHIKFPALSTEVNSVSEFQLPSPPHKAKVLRYQTVKAPLHSAFSRHVRASGQANLSSIGALPQHRLTERAIRRIIDRVRTILQAGTIILKWHRRTRRYPFLGHSSDHSSTVDSLRNLPPGLVSPKYPQFVFDDASFSTVPTPEGATSPSEGVALYDDSAHDAQATNNDGKRSAVSVDTDDEGL